MPCKNNYEDNGWGLTCSKHSEKYAWYPVVTHSALSNSQVIYTVTQAALTGAAEQANNYIGWIDNLMGATAQTGASTTVINYPTAQTPSQFVYPQMNWQLMNWYQQQAYRMPVSAWMVNDVVETPEERRQREARDIERKAKRAAAQARAENLLFTILTPQQVRSYKDDAQFEVDINGRIYRIKSGISGNVELIEQGKAKYRYCAHPVNAHETPVPDVMLSQLLMLKANEAEFLKVANRTVLQ